MTDLSPDVSRGSTPYSRMSLDVETRSAADLPKCGAQAYARHPTTDCLVACFAFDDEAPETWVRGQPVPQKVIDYILCGDGPIFAFNAVFEHEILRHVLGPKHGWPVPPIERMFCTAAMAATMALPRRLGQVVVALGLEEEKDEGGRRVMMQMSRPRSKPGEPLRWWEPEDVPEKFARLCTYCANDVVIERASAKLLRPLSAREREIWLENYAINERGLPIDVPSVRHALKIVDKVLARLDREIAILTRNRATKVSQTARIQEWLVERGLVSESLDKAHMRDLLARTDLSTDVKKVLLLRQAGAKSSTAKLKAFLACLCEDGVVRGTHRYHGASTGRDAGELVQPQNFPRGWLKRTAMPAVFDAIATEDPDWLEVWGEPLDVISSALRGMIRAPEGQLIYAGDLSNIEGRMAAWLADEEWKLQAFRDYDAGIGPDLYKVAAGGMFGIPPESIGDDDDVRQVGKVNELSMQFQGGHGAFITMGANYGLTPEKVAPIIKAAMPAELWAAGLERYDPKNRYELPQDQWTALRLTIDAWRAKHARIVQAWADCEEAAIAAVRHPGRSFTAGHLAFACAAGILWLRLPNGKLLSFVDPQIRETDTPWGSKKNALTYMTLDTMTKRYVRRVGYGGLIFQNAVQGSAREVIMSAKLRFKSRGWNTFMKVHDELCVLAPPTLDLADFTAELARPDPDFPGLPIAAKASVTPRYGK